MLPHTHTRTHHLYTNPKSQSTDEIYENRALKWKNLSVYMKIICLIHRMHGGHNLMLNLIHSIWMQGQIQYFGERSLRRVRLMVSLLKHTFSIFAYFYLSKCGSVQAIAGQPHSLSRSPAGSRSLSLSLESLLLSHFFFLSILPDVDVCWLPG